MIILIESVELENGTKYRIELDSDKGEYIIRYILINKDELMDKIGYDTKIGKNDVKTLPKNFDVFSGEYYYANLETALKSMIKRTPRLLLQTSRVKDIKHLLEALDDYKLTISESITNKVKKDKI